ncbi:MAG: Glu/Leu/Phe/Val dehydrogenase dimerization domain-containing protein, partial [Chloroflexota bacterium]
MEKNRTKPPSPVSPPQLVVDVFDEPFGKLGYVVIDRPVQGIASGGVRFAPDVSVDELAGLARSMTYKWAFLNVPLGGAKSGIFADPSQLGCDRATLMEAFGRSIAPLVRQHVYYPGVDLGTTLDDLRAIMRGVGQPLPEKQIDGSFCTALTVFEAIRQTIKFNGLKLANLRVAVEGFGKV